MRTLKKAATVDVLKSVSILKGGWDPAEGKLQSSKAQKALPTSSAP